MSEQPGLVESLEALRAVREEWGATTIVGVWDTPGGEVALVVDRDGWRVFAGGECVIPEP